MTKVYGIGGQTTALINIPFNGGIGHIQCEFRRGVIGRGPNNRPATFATSDEAVQRIIEDSDYFGHRIRLVRIINDGVPSTEPIPAFLKAHGAKASNLKDDESIKKYMAKIGVSFPNFEF